MDESIALEGLSALAQPTRLAVFRLLVRTGPEGLPAGAIAESLGARQNTVSTHLGILARAGLIRSERRGRTVLYAVRLKGAQELIAFLLEDCCQGRPEVCAPLIREVMPSCLPLSEG